MGAIRAPRRPRLAYFTPWPPEASGVADYSARLVPDLARYADVDVVVAGLAAGRPEPAAAGARVVSVETYHWLRSLSHYDRVLLCIGNSRYHCHALEELWRGGGTVILHDAKLAALYEQYASLHHGGGARDWYLAQARRMYPRPASELEAMPIGAPSPLCMSGDVATGADAVLVHSRHAAELVRRDNPTRTPDVRVVPFGIPAPRARPPRAPDRVGDPLIAVVGVVNAVKNLDTILPAFGRVAAGRPAARLVIAGPLAVPEDEVRAPIAAESLEDRVDVVGWLADADYWGLLLRADLAVQLRTSSHGEASASICDCFAARLPTIATDAGWAAELPPGTAARVPADVDAAALAGVMTRLCDDRPAARTLAHAAARYAKEASFASVAAAYARALDLSDPTGDRPHRARRRVSFHELAAEARSAQARRPTGVNVAGYLRTEFGIGEAARQTIAALDAAAVPVMPIEGRAEYDPVQRQGATLPAFGTDAALYPVNLICINGDGIAWFAEQAGRSFVEGRYTIGFWWWEVHGALPQEWFPAFDHLDELWVGSRHVAAALEPFAPVPVTTVGIPIAIPRPPRRTRAEVGLPGGFAFITLFDFFSGLGRKNALGVIDAFTSAFRPGAGASLVVKTTNADFFPDEADLVRAAAARHPDVHLVDGYLAASDKNALLAAADCCVSLHRAEGLCLPAGEAMLLGKPVIATRYGGNLDFMSDRNSLLVDYTMTPVRDGGPAYELEAQWAEPDLDHAARLMRRVVERPDERAQLGARAAADVRRTHAAEVVGARMAARLSQIEEIVRARQGGGGDVREGDPAARRAEVAVLAQLRDHARRLEAASAALEDLARGRDA